jgi:hypothetical protein
MKTVTAYKCLNGTLEEKKNELLLGIFTIR